MTAQPYKFLVEHAYNQFFQHEAFMNLHVQEQRQRILVQVNFTPSTKLDGYVWIGTRDNIVHIPKNHTEDVEMQEGNAEEEEEEEDTLPTLEVSIRRQPQGEESRRCRLSKGRGNITSPRTL